MVIPQVVRDGASIRKLDRPLSLDLSSVKTKRFLQKDRVPFRLRRLLEGINRSKPYRPRNGLFCQDWSDVRKGYDEMASWADLCSTDKRGVYGLAKAEVKEASKRMLPTGQIAYSYVDSERLPWEASGKDFEVREDVLATCMKLMRAAGLAAGLPMDDREFMRSLRPSELWRAGHSFPYTHGKFTGVFPYVPGKDPNNVFALVFHSLNAQHYSRMVANGATAPLDASYADLAGSKLYMEHAHCIVPISRVRYMSNDKENLIWNKAPGALIATHQSSGVFTKNRLISAVDASFNMLFGPSVHALSRMWHAIPGQRLGHPVMTHAISNIAFKIFGAGITINAEDQSRYDQHVGETAARVISTFYERLFHFDAADDLIMSQYHRCPVVTKGLVSDDQDSYDLSESVFGIKSGFYGTSSDGKAMNLYKMFHALSAVTGRSPSALLESSINWKMMMRQDVSGAEWGWSNQGDDLLLFAKSGFISWREYNAYASELGFESTDEGSIIMLRTFLDPARNIKGSDMIGWSDKFKGYRGMNLYGLCASRLGGMRFAEHPATDERPMIAGYYDRLVGCQTSPYYEEFLDVMYDSFGKDLGLPRDLEDVHRFVTSPSFKDSLVEYGETAGKKDPWLESLIRRATGGDVLDDDSALANLPSALLGDVAADLLKVGFGKPLSESDVLLAAKAGVEAPSEGGLPRGRSMIKAGHLSSTELRSIAEEALIKCEESY